MDWALYPVGVTDRIVYVTRVTRLPLVGADGADVGRVVDVVLDLGGRPPRVNGFVVAVGRRRVFVGAGRVGEIANDGLRLRRGSINLRQFELRAGERLVIGELIGRPRPGRPRRRRRAHARRPSRSPGRWPRSRVGSRGLAGRRRAPEVLDWSEAGELFADERPIDRQAAALGGLHPVEMSAAIRRLPLSRRRVLASDARGRPARRPARGARTRTSRCGSSRGSIRSVSPACSTRWRPTTPPTCSASSPASRQAELLGAMDPEEAEPVRRLLIYKPDTAGGLMTPEPVILDAQATVAEALARIRDPDLPVPLAAQVFVCQPPLETPTGRFLGVVGIQRLLREAPGKPLGRCLDDEWDPISADASEREVAERLAAYDVVAIPVTDPAKRLVGAVTIDDVLDRMLPADWRVARASR